MTETLPLVTLAYATTARQSTSRPIMLLVAALPLPTVVPRITAWVLMLVGTLSAESTYGFRGPFQESIMSLMRVIAGVLVSVLALSARKHQRTRIVALGCLIFATVIIADSVASATVLWGSFFKQHLSLTTRVNLAIHTIVVGCGDALVPFTAYLMLRRFNDRPPDDARIGLIG